MNKIIYINPGQPYLGWPHFYQCVKQRHFQMSFQMEIILRFIIMNSKKKITLPGLKNTLVSPNL